MCIRDSIPKPVDLAVVVVPAKLVPGVLRECGEKGVRGAIVISAGFSEVGNVELEEELRRVAEEHGIRVVGPNCLGVYDPYTGVDTLFLPTHKILKDGRKLLSIPRPKPGYVSFVSQSGAFGTAALDYMAGEGIGIRTFVSYGNRADVDEADLLEYFAEDDKTRVVMMYVESIERGRKFLEVASRTTLRKPVVAIKTGRTKAGSRAAASHTASMTGVDEIYEAAFRKAGVVRTYSMEEFLDAAKALAFQPPARDKRVGILTDGGGAGVMATDALESLGLEVPEFSGETRGELEGLVKRGVVPPFATIGNPVDLTGSATTEMYVEVFRVMLESDQVDAVLVIALHHVPAITDPLELVEEMCKVAKEYKKPVVVCDIGSSEAAVAVRDGFDEHYVPSYPSPERCAHALRALVEYGAYLKKRGVLEDYLNSWSPAA